MRRMPLAKDALPYIVGLGAAALLSFLFVSGWLAIVWVVMLLFITFFFRDPERAVAAGGETVLLAPADGRVVQLRDEEGLKGLSIFLSIFDVHVNRSPASGQVESVRYTPGRFQAAFRHGASIENERNAIVLATSLGPVRVIQIAGVLARRIVCTLREGDRVKAGDRIGLIKFGSRVDLLVPPSVTWKVEVGTRVKAGLTVVAVGPKENAGA
jgi:phosphatidylserine decarboxylase